MYVYIYYIYIYIYIYLYIYIYIYMYIAIMEIREVMVSVTANQWCTQPKLVSSANDDCKPRTVVTISYCVIA